MASPSRGDAELRGLGDGRAVIPTKKRSYFSSDEAVLIGGMGN